MLSFYRTSGNEIGVVGDDFLDVRVFKYKAQQQIVNDCIDMIALHSVIIV